MVVNAQEAGTGTGSLSTTGMGMEASRLSTGSGTSGNTTTGIAIGTDAGNIGGGTLAGGEGSSDGGGR